MRKVSGCLFHFQSVAVSVSVKSLVLQGFFLYGNESNEEIEENPK